MRALSLDFGQRSLAWREHREPGEPGPGEVLLEVREVGVCGTDRELAQFQYAEPPAGESSLILGHEALGQVAACGPGVRGLQPGDWVTPMLRRPCPAVCPSCARGRRDLCLTGEFRERGIFRAHGYFQARTLDHAEDLVKVPAELNGVAVLMEPLSVVQKAIEAALGVHPGEPRTAAVLGAGPIGLLAALALDASGYEVTVASLEPADHPRLRVLREAGIPYAEARGGIPPADITLEATGSSEAARAAVEGMPPLGVLIVVGAHRIPEVPALRMILHNQTIRGVVNAGPAHFEQACASLRRIERRHLEALLDRRPAAAAPQSLLEPPGPAAKCVHVLAE